MSLKPGRLLSFLHYSLGSSLFWFSKGRLPRKFCYRQMKPLGSQAMTLFCSNGREEPVMQFQSVPERSGKSSCSTSLLLWWTFHFKGSQGNRASQERLRESMGKERIAERRQCKSAKKGKQGWGILVVNSHFQDSFLKCLLESEG